VAQVEVGAMVDAVAVAAAAVVGAADFSAGIRLKRALTYAA
jgi:hypothetical protein